MRAIGFGLCSVLVLGTTTASAADLGTVKVPDGDLALPANTIGLEVSPSFYAASTSSHRANAYDDTSVQLNLTHRFESPFSVEATLKDDIKQEGKRQYYAEGRAAYRFDFGRFALTPSAALGVTWSDTGFGAGGDATAAYYAFYLAGDLKLSQKLTWTVFDLRYRDAFDYVWVTPEIATGLSYRLTHADRIYGTASYSWKGSGDGIKPDTYSVAFGVEHGF